MIICDSLDRTLETAEIISETMDISQIVVIRGLHPLHMGDWTLQSKEKFPSESLWKDPSKAPPNGESLNQFDARELQVFKHVFAMADENPNGKILVIGHGSNVAFLHNKVFNESDEPVPYEGLVDAGGLINATTKGLVPLTKIRGERDEEEKGNSDRISSEDAEYVELKGAVKDADCEKVYVEGGVSKERGCCDKFEAKDDSVEGFKCATCEYVTARG